MAGAADVVFAGDDEAALFVGPADDPLELASRIEALGPAQVIIKLGERGCVAIIDGTAHRTDAFAVDALDTVGAGDGFVAGYVSELLAGFPPTAALIPRCVLGLSRAWCPAIGKVCPAATS